MAIHSAKSNQDSADHSRCGTVTPSRPKSRVLNLSQLDALTAQLDLTIGDAPEAFQCAICTDFCFVTGTVYTAVWRIDEYIFRFLLIV